MEPTCLNRWVDCPRHAQSSNKWTFKNFITFTVWITNNLNNKIAKSLLSFDLSTLWLELMVVNITISVLNYTIFVIITLFLLHIVFDDVLINIEDISQIDNWQMLIWDKGFISNHFECKLNYFSNPWFCYEHKRFC
jgi:hypothetical protein